MTGHHVSRGTKPGHFSHMKQMSSTVNVGARNPASPWCQIWVGCSWGSSEAKTVYCWKGARDLFLPKSPQYWRAEFHYCKREVTDTQGWGMHGLRFGTQCLSESGARTEGLEPPPSTMSLGLRNKQKQSNLLPEERQECSKRPVYGVGIWKAENGAETLREKPCSSPGLTLNTQ